MDPIKTWTFGEKKNVSDHLKICPYNVRNRHDRLKQNDEKWNEVMEDLVITLKQKQTERT